MSHFWGALQFDSFQLRPLPSPGITRLHRYYGPLRHPKRPGLTLASCRLIPTAITAGASRVASGPLCLHAVANTPAGSMETVRSSFPSTSAFPRFSAGQLLHYPFRGLHNVHDCYGLQTRQVTNVTLYTRGFSSFVASTTAPIATGWSEPVPGWDFSHCGPAPFHGAREMQVNGLNQIPQASLQNRWCQEWFGQVRENMFFQKFPPFDQRLAPITS